MIFNLKMIYSGSRSLFIAIYCMYFIILKISKTKLQPSDFKEVNLKNPTDEHDFKFVNYINENDLNII